MAMIDHSEKIVGGCDMSANIGITEFNKELSRCLKKAPSS
jgi:hypothetical protein